MPTPMRPSPAAVTPSRGRRTISRAAAADPAITETLSGNSVAAASSGLQPSVPCRYSVMRVGTPPRR
jgi:hypothetical protein